MKVQRMDICSAQVPKELLLQTVMAVGGTLHFRLSARSVCVGSSFETMLCPRPVRCSVWGGSGIPQVLLYTKANTIGGPAPAAACQIATEAKYSGVSPLTLFQIPRMKTLHH